MNTPKLFSDFGISYSETQNNWINIQCCWCDDPSEHLGFSLTNDYCNCFRCGPHYLDQTIGKLLNLTKAQTYQLIKQYGGKSKRKIKPTAIRMKAHLLPSGVSPLMKNHRQYLEKRGFDPEKLEREWRLLGTGPFSLLDELDYKHRIIAPIFWNGKQVSFQSRAISERSDRRYKCCPPDRELVHHKHILYGRQEAWEKTGIVVEGITDVWRLGEKAFATFGTEFTSWQVNVMAKHFKRVFIVFDTEIQATKQAKKLAASLREGGVVVHRIILSPGEDPGSMSQKDANHLVKQILPK